MSPGRVQWARSRYDALSENVAKKYHITNTNADALDRAITAWLLVGVIAFWLLWGGPAFWFTLPVYLYLLWYTVRLRARTEVMRADIERAHAMQGVSDYTREFSLEDERFGVQ